MANLSEETKWENGIYQLEIDDPLQGGADGIDNVQAKQLANRTRYLKEKIESTYSKAQTDALLADLYASARTDESKARNLLDVLGIRSVHSDTPATEAEAKGCILEMHNRLQAGDTSWYRDCDYLDLASITVDGNTYTWNASYKNLRLMNMGLNVYKGAGDTENTQNHVVMQFRNCVLTKRMNATDTNTGGYASSELYSWLNDKFKAGLVAALGNYLYTVRRLLSTKSSWAWADDTVFLPTEHEIWGTNVWSEEWDGGFQAQWPAYKDSAIYKVKKHNGSRMWWWEATPFKDNAVSFCHVGRGYANDGNGASAAGGVSPAICVA